MNVGVTSGFKERGVGPIYSHGLKTSRLSRTPT
jgi:hypothetical protein